ncbi:aminopeptidase N-like [Echeneis naucrates]|uniref:Aminopeptidase n=1 Tax=Echeneis naucrates TaxID=173247 RepID=A0A665W1Q9_ECHNA|nr:aminopeptidase N-like [Echeneis naucrates]
MAKDTHISKAIAIAFVVLTISAIAGLITMIILYKAQISAMNPTPPPTVPSTTTVLPPTMRLPRSVIPESYEVFLRFPFYTKILEVVNVTSPNQTTNFSGNTTIHFQCVQRTSTIYIHSMELEVSEAKVFNRNTDGEIQVSSMSSHEDHSEFLVIELNEALESGGNYSLSLVFVGELYHNFDGAYISSYTEGVPSHEGDKSADRFLIITNNEPIYARNVFPCFDEPEMKAVFNVTIIHRRQTTALANAPVDKIQLIDDWKYTRFHSTPKMSTYLFAFAVSEFEATASSYEPVVIKTYARPEAVAAGHTKYAAEITGKILSFYENLFEIKYMQQKLDQIALPDLSPAAMENWGLITYQEGALLYEEGASSSLQKESIATIIAHELAHQWFGNLVTMKWWNQLFLKEGFATYISCFAVDHVEPSFNMKDSFFASELQAAFEVDSLTSSHPLVPPEEDIQRTYDIISLYDIITYSKGAIVLRMLEDVLEAPAFIQGIRMYLRDLSYANGDQNDLWHYMQKGADANNRQVDVAKFMDSWTKQIGYPVITINTTSGEISQKHFLFNDSSQSSLVWDVPIRVMSKTFLSPKPVFLKTSQPEIWDELISSSGDWLLANVNCTGYYRVNYNPENWEALLTQLETNRSLIPLMNRMQLIDDAFNLARAKIVNVTLALNVTRFLYNETDFHPWDSAMRNFQYIYLMFDRTEVYGPMQTYLRSQVRNLYMFFSNSTDHSQVPVDHMQQQSQTLAVQVACNSGLPDCVAMAKRMFGLWMKDNTNIIHPNLRHWIYCEAVASGGKEEWDFAWSQYQSTNDTSEKYHLRHALSCTKKIWLLNRYLGYTLDPEKIQQVDAAEIVSSISKSVAGQVLAWNFIRAHWDYLSHGGPAVLIHAVTSRFSTQFELQELERFAADYHLGSAERVVQQAIEQTRVNIQWVSEHKDVLLQWFERETAS